MGKRSIVLLAALAMLASMVAGCGGDESADGTAATTEPATSSDTTTPGAGDATSGDATGDETTGDETTTETTPEQTAPLAKAEFVKRGNEICARASKRFEDAFALLVQANEATTKSKALSRSALRDAAEELFIPTVARQLEELRSLGPPSGEEEEVDEMLSAAEEALAESEADPTLLMVEGAGPFEEANELAREYGLQRCGEEG